MSSITYLEEDLNKSFPLPRLEIRALEKENEKGKYVEYTYSFFQIQNGRIISILLDKVEIQGESLDEKWYPWNIGADMIIDSNSMNLPSYFIPIFKPPKLIRKNLHQ